MTIHKLYFKKYKLIKPITKNHLLGLGARMISEFICEDRYFTNSKNLNQYKKIRIEGNQDERIISEKQIIKNKELIIQNITSKVILHSEKLPKDYLEIAHIHKKRTTFILGPLIIYIDKLEKYGDYLILTVMKEKDIPLIDSFSEKLKFKIKKPAINKSYLELVINSQNSATIFFHKLCEKFGRFAFGISGGVLTTLGVMMGLLGATASKLAVIGGIVSVAIADSLSDSISMYSSKKVERGTTNKFAIISALNTFVGKFVFTLIFILSFLIFSFDLAIKINIIFGIFLIALINLTIAIIQEENKAITVIKNTLFALIVIVLAYYAGLLINIFFGI